MRKNYQLIGVAAIMAAGIQGMEMSGQNLIDPMSDAGWVTYNAGSGTNFVSYSTKPAGFGYAYSIWQASAAQKDCWLSSPAIELEAGASYEVGFQYLGWDGTTKVEKLDVYMADVQAESGTVDAIKGETPVMTMTEFPNITQNRTWEMVTVPEAVSGSGTKYLVVNVSGEVCRRFSLSGFTVTKIEATSAQASAPTDLTAVTDGETLSVDLSWVNPTTDVAGEALGEIEAVKVFRDGELATMIEGSATEFTDTDVTGLTAGEHSYEVCVVVGGKDGEMSETVNVDVVVAVSAATLPWSGDVSQDNFDEKWTVYNPGGATKWLGRPAGIFLSATYNRAATWLISEPMKLEGGLMGYYQVDYRLNSSVSDGQDVEIGFVDSTEPEEFLGGRPAKMIIGQDAFAVLSPEEGAWHAPAKVASEGGREVRLAVRNNPNPSLSYTLTLTKIGVKVATPTGVESVSAEGAVKEIEGIYGLDGREATGDEKGIFVVKYKDGGTAKIVR